MSDIMGVRIILTVVCPIAFVTTTHVLFIHKYLAFFYVDLTIELNGRPSEI